MGLGIIARPLLAAVFIWGGIDQFNNPEGRAKAVEATCKKIPFDVGAEGAQTLVKANGVVMAGAGAALAVGIAPKAAAVALIAALVPTTVVGHPFWTMADPKVRAQNRSQVLKNAAIVGGLVQVLAQRKAARKVPLA